MYAKGAEKAEQYETPKQVQETQNLKLKLLKKIKDTYHILLEDLNGK